jgi:PhnB protein
MKAINPYLNFDGNAREAMTFYAKALDADLSLQTFGETGMKDPAAADRVMHARLVPKGTDSSMMSGGEAILMASDSQPGQPVTVGDNIWLSVQSSDLAEQERMFNAIGDGGKVVMALNDTFWGARFGMVKDKFGLGWMFNCELKK